MFKSKLFLLIFSLVIFIFFSGCEKKQNEVKPAPVAVTALKVGTQTVPFSYETVGQTESANLVEVRAKVSGYLIRRAFQEGRPVKKGDVLFEIDPKPFMAALDNAKAELSQAEAKASTAVQNLNRIKPLAAANAVSKRDLDFAVGNQESSAAGVSAAKAKVEEAVLNLEYATIKSPIDGMISRSSIKEGSLVSVNAGQEGILATITPFDTINVNFGVSESDNLKLQRSRKAGTIVLPPNDEFKIELQLADGSVYPHEGLVSFRDPNINPKTGMFMVTAMVANPDGELVPGQFLRVRLLGVDIPNSILIPQKAVFQGQNGKFVYIVDDGNKVRLQNVEVGNWLGDDWIITSGINAGDVVVIDGTSKLFPGAEVKVDMVEADKSKADSEVEAAG